MDRVYTMAVQDSIAAVRAYLAVMDEYAAAKHSYQVKIADLEQEVFWGRHTDDAGNPVSLDDSGTVVPMSVDQIQAAQEVYKSSILSVATSQAVAEEMRLKIEMGLEELARISQRHADGSLSDADAMSQLQAAMSTAMGAGSAIAIRAATGGL